VVAYSHIGIVLHRPGGEVRIITYKLYGNSAERLLQGFGQDGHRHGWQAPFKSRYELPAFLLSVYNPSPSYHSPDASAHRELRYDFIRVVFARSAGRAEGVSSRHRCPVLC
jgi:hypothetical protein